MRYPRAVPLAIFVLIASITVLSIFSIERGEVQRASAQLRGRATAIASALERRSNSSSAYLRAGAALFASVPDMPPAQFDRFVSELHLDTDYRGTDSIGWAPIVPTAQLAEFEQGMAEETGHEYSVYPRPDPAKRTIIPVAYLFPEGERNLRALGFDMSSEQNRRVAMDAAKNTASPTATRRVVLEQDADDQAAGFLIYMPVYDRGPSGTVLRGFVYSPFNAQAFLNSALELADEGSYVVQLYDGDADSSALLASSIDIASTQGNSTAVDVNIANNPWKLKVSSADRSGLSGLSMVTLIFGLLVASLLMLLVRMLTQQAIEDEASLAFLEEQASIRNSLTRELNHRVKNTLANVLSIIALTRRRASSLDDFANGLDGRIRALSATHDLLTNSGWGKTPVRAVIEAELIPYAQGADHVVDMQGPEVELAPNDALSLGLAMHELATNAAKYGALSRVGGRVSVHWKLASENIVRIEWLERGGPEVPESRGRGFGTDLIERIVAHELKTPVILTFERHGVRCVLMIPVRQPTKFILRAAHATSANPAEGPAAHPSARIAAKAVPK